MKNSFSILVLLLVLFSCNKYEHPPQETPACTLCPFAKSIEGTYRGLAVGYGVKNNPNLGSSFPKDSLTLIVEQVFQGKSNYIDSTIMYFKTIMIYDFEPHPKTKVVQILSNDGFVENSGSKINPNPNPNISNYPLNYFYITPEKAIIRREVKGKGSSMVVAVESAILIKQ